MSYKTAHWFLEISRPRFWIYLLGPFLIGTAAAISADSAALTNYRLLQIIVIGLFFTIPANLMIYGLNDLFDYETDKHNPKKKSYETLLEPKNRVFFLKVLSIVLIPSLAAVLFVIMGDNQYSSPSYASLWSLVGFMFFGIFYSTPPIRAKVIPFVDSFFNILYIFPGLIVYGILTGSYPPLDIIIASTLWCMAMHAFSAVPDIESDRKANLNTVATVLGANGTIAFCSLAYGIAALIAVSYIGVFGFIGGFVYLTTMVLAYKTKSPKELFKIYKFFPNINAIVGFSLFWVIFFS